MQLARRKFFGVFAGSLAAAPVAAKAVAERMGLSSVTQAGLGGANLAQYAGEAKCATEGSTEGPNAGDMLKKLRDRLARLVSGEDLGYIGHLKRDARQLDPDIAAMRSISPGAAYLLQRRRLERAYVESYKRDIERDIAHYTKQSAKEFLGLGN